jgi:protein tyrosine phosphatase (PTP) superfamily phosphohydrolase (DUF442 family)
MVKHQPTISRRLHLEGIPNFGQVSPTLFRGGQPTETGFANLARMGIEIVVDNRGDRKSERDLVTRMGMQYVSIAWHCPHPTDKPFARFLKLLQENPGKKIFVHCRLGDDRTGMMIAAYRMADERWTAQQALNEMKEFGFTRFHHLICWGLPSYEAKFPQILQSSPAFHGLASAPSQP